jgi:hypothetical protein
MMRYIVHHNPTENPPTSLIYDFLYINQPKYPINRRAEASGLCCILEANEQVQ